MTTVQDSAISVRNLSKSYRLKTPVDRISGLVDVLKSPGRLFSIANRKVIQALDDVSFDIERGKAVALIGSNGAGKSTLLRILSRISEPTSGYADVEGSVGSLLDVGVGFHPELSGRENVFLGGAILGMKRREVQKSLDAIVDFSGVGQQIDMPIKHYSSGQWLRLGFAVAAFLRHDILLLDEVLSVGDIEFQRKCLTKVQELMGQGRTAIVVSHNFGLTSQLCDTAIYLRGGKLQEQGLFQETLSKYVSYALGGANDVMARGQMHQPDISSACLQSAEGLSVEWGQLLSFKVQITGGDTNTLVTGGMQIMNAGDHTVVSAISAYPVSLPAGERLTARLTCGDCHLVPGVYSVRLFLLDPDEQGQLQRTCEFLLDPAFYVVPAAAMPAVPLTGQYDGTYKILEMTTESQCDG